jgi:hypothetical protein
VLRLTDYHPTSNSSMTSPAMRRRMNKAHCDCAAELSPPSYTPTAASQRHHLSESKPTPHGHWSTWLMAKSSPRIIPFLVYLARSASREIALRTGWSLFLVNQWTPTLPTLPTIMSRRPNPTWMNLWTFGVYALAQK